MTFKAGKTLFLVGLFLFAAASISKAQEASSFPVIEELIEGDREKSEHLSEEESKTHQKAVRDSIAIRQQAFRQRERTSERQQASNPEEEALSFNFLYYIIQRVKMSDIMDE